MRQQAGEVVKSMSMICTQAQRRLSLNQKIETA
jgi:hypothetical protein